MINDHEIAKYYDEVTPLYMQDHGCNYQACLLDTNAPNVDTLNFLLEALNVKKGDNVFDAGCGLGVASMYFARKVPGTTYYGVTISKRQADIANELIKNNKLENKVFVKQGNYHDLDDPNNFFDKAFFFESSCYSSNIFTLVNQIARILKNDGTLLIKDIFLSKNREDLSIEELKEVSSLENTYKLNLSSVNDMKEALTHNGFVNIDILPLDENWSLEAFHESMIDKEGELNDFGKYNELTQDVHETTTWAIIKTKIQK